MKLSARAKSRFLIVGSMAAPVIAALAVRVLCGVGPAVSSGYVGPAGINPEPPLTLVKAPEPTPEQTRALQWLALHAGDRPVRCPMEQPTVPPPPLVPEPIVPPDPVTPKGPDPVATLSVTAIIAGDQGNLARINGKLFAPGFTPMTGWTITRIDPDKGLVELTGPDGKLVNLLLKRPDPKN